MANAIETLRSGIQTRNWKKIEEAYLTLTGEKIVVEDTNSELNNIDEFMNDIDKLMNKYGYQPVLSGKKNKRQTPPIDLEPIPIPAPSPKTISRYPSTGYFGNQSVQITCEATEKEIQENESKKIKKEKRESPKTYQVKCSICDKSFTSYTQASDELGQRCSKCIRDSVKNDK